MATQTQAQSQSLKGPLTGDTDFERLSDARLRVIARLQRGRRLGKANEARLRRLLALIELRLDRLKP